MNQIDFAVIAGYFLLTLIIGLYSGRKVSTFKQYVIGDGKMPSSILFMTIAATAFSGSSIISTTEQVYLFGSISLFMALAWALGGYFVAKFCAPGFMRFKNCFTIGEVVKKLYGPNAQILTGICGVLIAIGYIAAQIKATSFILEYFFGVDAIYGIILSSMVVTIYSAVGGVNSVTFTDALQFIVLIIFVIFTFNICTSVNGGLDNIMALSAHYNTVDQGWAFYLKYAVLFIYFSVPGFTPPLVQRMLMVSNVAQFRMIFGTFGVTSAVYKIIILIIGIIAINLNPGIDSKYIILHTIQEFMPAGLKGLAIIGMLAAIMSTADSHANAASTSFIHDTLTPLGLLKKDKELLASKLLTFVIGIGAIFLALQFKYILDIALFAMNFWGPIVGMPLLMGFLGFNTTPRVFFISAFSASFVFVIWYSLQLEAAWGITGLIPAYAVNVISMLLSHKLLGEPGGWVKYELEEETEENQPMTMREFSIRVWVGLKEFFFAAMQELKKGGLINQLSHKDIALYTLGFLALYFVLFDIRDHAAFWFVIPAGLLSILLLLDAHFGLENKAARSMALVTLYVVGYTTWPVYDILNTGITIANITKYAVLLFALSLFVDWRIFLTISATGICAAFFVVFVINGEAAINVAKQDLAHVGLLIIPMLMFGAMFLRKKQTAFDDELVATKAIGGMIAHEIRNTLLSVSMNANMIQTIKDDDQFKVNLAKNIELASKRLDKTLDLFLTNLRSSDYVGKPELISPKAIIQNIVAEQDAEFKQRISVNLQDHKVMFDETMLTNILINLIKNAVYFLEKHPESELKIYDEMGPLGYKLHLEDNAEGIAPEFLPHIFEPFAGTKQNGTGLGLYYCNNAMVANNGSITCDSELGKFTKFSLCF